MKTKTTYRRAAGARSTGFTLTELLVVVAIIAILIGLVVPTVGVVRKQAKVAATKAILATVDTGLETYKADGKVGGSYPPSFPDAPEGSNYGKVITPYVKDNTSQRISITGAGLLVWTLAGADLLGTPGFRPFAGKSLWADSTGSGDENTQPHAYSLYPDTDPKRPGQPKNQRFGPYVDLSKVKITPADDVNREKFYVPAELDARGSKTLRDFPMFLDAFGYPLLFWRADPAGRALAWQTRTDKNNPRGTYTHEDNASLVTGTAALRLSSSGEANRLDWDAGWNSSKNPVAGTFQHYIWNSQVTARREAFRPESYLVAAPGPDGLYGSADDIANFDHQGN